MIGWLRRLLGPFFGPFVAVLVALAVLGVGVFVRYAFVTTADDAAVAAAPRIHDLAFARAASAQCHQSAQVFDTATTLGHFPSATERGDFLDTIAGQFDDLVTGLRTLAVAPPDRAAVDQWLADWDAYNTYGHQYAAAVRAGAERDLIGRDKGRIDALLRRRNGFARANHLSACAFN